MYCEFCYCIYNREASCLLYETQINSLGMCELCEIVPIPKEVLERYKDKRLDEVDSFWAAREK